MRPYWWNGCQTANVYRWVWLYLSVRHDGPPLQGEDAPGGVREAGAADGEGISNTLFFEAKYNWTGLLVEANPDELKELFSKHRNAYILPHCLSTKPEVDIVTFDVSGEISGIIVEGKVRPSRVGDDPNRPDLKYERKIQVTT